MIPEDYVQSLVDYATDIGDASELIAERNALFATMQSGGKAGKVLVNSDLNNKQFGFQVSMTVEEKFTAFTQAVKLYNGATKPMTFGVFPWLIR